MELTCPLCGKASLHRSRARSIAERIRLRLTNRVPFRCHDCNWRGWLPRALTNPAASGPRGIHRDLTEAELERLDPDKH